MLLDMSSPGVRVSPIRQLTGEADYNEVFLEDVEVSDDNIVGGEGEGWRIAMAAAEYERGIYFLPRVIQLESELVEIQQLFAEFSGDAFTRNRMMASLQSLADTCSVIRWRVEQILARVAEGSTPGVDGAVLKLLWSETRQALMDIRFELLGERGVLGPSAGNQYPEEASAVREFLWSRAETIVAGTSEIQRNIVAERILGLPKDNHGSAS
jgi:hypothetical protein